jgi:hypothetical protein
VACHRSSSMTQARVVLQPPSPAPHLPAPAPNCGQESQNLQTRPGGLGPRSESWRSSRAAEARRPRPRPSRANEARARARRGRPRPASAPVQQPRSVPAPVECSRGPRPWRAAEARARAHRGRLRPAPQNPLPARPAMVKAPTLPLRPPPPPRLEGSNWPAGRRGRHRSPASS